MLFRNVRFISECQSKCSCMFRFANRNIKTCVSSRCSVFVGVVTGFLLLLLQSKTILFTSHFITILRP